jgi:protease IV
MNIRDRLCIQHRSLALLLALVAFAFLASAGPPICLAQESETAESASTAEEAVEKQADDAANSDEKQDDSADAEKESKSGDEAATAGETEGSKNGEATKADESADSKSEQDEHKSKESAKAKPQSNTTSKAGAVSTKKEKKPATQREKVRLALVTLKNELPETAGQEGPFAETQLDLREAVKRIEKAAKDKSISGIVFDIQNPSIGRGKVDELRAAISRFRAAGKKAYAMLETAMPSDYLVACACDEIVMPETGIVMLPGVHAEATFYKGLLGKLGIQADFIHIGDYKGAAEPLMREKFSEPVRENLTSLIDSIYDDMVTTIVKDRPISIAQAKEIIDTGLVTAKKAKQLGLIDRVAYSETLRDELAKAYDAEALVYVKNYGQKKVDTDFSGPMGFFKLLQTMMGGGSSSGDRRGKKIAVVYAIGPIMSGKSENTVFGQTMGSTTIVDALRKANDDKQVAAIVLRIDSPGGSAIASDLIWHQTQEIEKPIVASMGDVAASGGYYIAMGADKILATPATVTGSIGVVGGKLAIRGLYEKIGITTETIERGKNSGLFSSSGKWTDSQRKVIRAMMEDIYGQFTSKAADGRDMPVEELRKLAGGRIYTGRQAKENGLVDQLGTLDDAIEEAKKLAGIEDDEAVKIEVLPEPTNFFETLFGDMDAEKEVRLGQGLEAIAPELIELTRRAYRLRAVFDQPAALVMPFELEIR